MNMRLPGKAGSTSTSIGTMSNPWSWTQREVGDSRKSGKDPGQESEGAETK